jgi:hypothetical protein
MRQKPELLTQFIPVLQNNIVTCHTVTKKRVWIGNWIYWILKVKSKGKAKAIPVTGREGP